MDCFTADLPLPVRVSMARAWMTARALELGLSNQPEEELNEALRGFIDLATDDLVDCGLDAMATLDGDMGNMLLIEVANQCQVCPNCLMVALFGDGEEEQQEEGK